MVSAFFVTLLQRQTTASSGSSTGVARVAAAVPSSRPSRSEGTGRSPSCSWVTEAMACGKPNRTAPATRSSASAIRA
ncbi:hypothetical protein ACFQ0O_18555 [Saccharopolyspora spinosporotrichia]